MKIKDYLEKKKFFEFYILNINEKDNNYSEIINIFTEVIVNAYVYQDNNHTVILSTVLNNDINQLVNALIEDFGIKFKVFKSNKIDSLNVEYLDIIKSLFYKHENNINDNYITVRNLLQIILEKDLSNIEVIKPVIVDKIINDVKLYEIVNGMFVNDLNVCKTANYVYMHRNTINNKLQVIEEETGLNIQKFQDAVLLYALVKK